MSTYCCPAGKWKCKLCAFIIFQLHLTCAGNIGAADFAAEAASQAWNVTSAFMSSHWNVTISPADSFNTRGIKELYKSRFLEAFGAASCLSENTDQIAVQIQVDAIANAPHLQHAVHLFSTWSNMYNVTLVSATVPKNANDIYLGQSTAPAVEGLWTDFAGASASDSTAYLDKKNIRQQLHFYYRRDVFAQHNLAVPETWEGLMDAAALLNGTDINNDGGMEYSVCFNTQPHCYGPYLMLSIVSSMMQSKGPSQGVLFDPASMEPLVNNPAMTRAMQIYANLSAYNSPLSNGNCWSYDQTFAQGLCAITISLDQYQYTTINESAPVYGKVATLFGPGSSYILDRHTSLLQPCNPHLCPQALPSTRDNKVLINYAHPVLTLYNTYITNFTTLAPSTPVVTAYIQASYTAYVAPFFNAFFTALGLTSGVPGADTMSQSSLEQTMVATFMDAVSDMFAKFESEDASVRANMTLGISPTPLLALGYHPSDTASYLAVMARVLTSGCMTMDIPLPGATYYRLVLADAANNVAAGAPVHIAVKQLDEKFRMILQVLNSTQYQHLYWRAIGYTPAAPRHKSSPLLVGQNLAITMSVLGAAAAALLVGGLLVYRNLMRQRRWTLLGRLVAPGAGAGTTLLISDVQDSTSLWEHLPMAVMEASMAVHHSIFRSLLDTHSAYESATEGDSFIIAFHTAADALHFAVAVQRALLVADWPEKLLQLSTLCSVHTAAAETGERNTALSNIVAKMQKPGGTFHHETGRRQSYSAALPPSSWYHILLPAASHAGCPASHNIHLKEISQEDDPVAGSVLPRRSSCAGMAEDLLDCTSFGQAISKAWSMSTAGTAAANSHAGAAPVPAAPSVMVWRGLRVRIGLHSGLTNPQLATRNSTTRRTQYSGSFLAAAKCVSDAGHGGQILLSDSAFSQLAQSSVPADVLMLDMGEHSMDALMEGPVRLYQVVVGGLEARLQSFPALKTQYAVDQGALQAPVGGVTIAFMTAAGLQTLLAWNTAVTREALQQYHREVRLKAMQHDGYVVELVDGLALVAFQWPDDAVRWALDVQNSLLQADWPQVLLEHELCERVSTSVCFQAENGDLTEVRKVTLRGLRLKVGIATGNVLDYINTTTGHLMYRGRVMNLAARICGQASCGQALCTHDTWELANQASSLEAEQITGTSEGLHMLKGIPKPTHLYSCHQASASAPGMPISRQSPADNCNKLTMRTTSFAKDRVSRLRGDSKSQLGPRPNVMMESAELDFSMMLTVSL